jgi:hypothetical protein
MLKSYEVQVSLDVGNSANKYICPSPYSLPLHVPELLLKAMVFLAIALVHIRKNKSPKVPPHISYPIAIFCAPYNLNM